MKLIKPFGFAALASVIAMALVGASPAMASKTAICKTNEGGLLACAEANQWKKVHAVATGPVILSSLGNVVCEGSLFEVTLLGLGAPQIGHNNSLLWSGCTNGAVPCTVVTSTLGTSLYLKTAANLGEMQFHGMTLSIKCGFGFECVYEGLPIFHLLGATAFGDGPDNNGGIRGVESEMTSGPLDGPCPPGIVLDVFWEALAPVYIKS